MFTVGKKTSTGTVVAQLLLLASCAAGVNAAASGDGISVETQLYITAGVLGGVLLVLCSAMVYLMLTVSSIQFELSRLKTTQGQELSNQQPRQEHPSIQGYENKSAEIKNRATPPEPSQQQLNSATAGGVTSPPQTAQQQQQAQLQPQQKLQRQLSFQDVAQPGYPQPAPARAQDPYTGRALGAPTLRQASQQPPTSGMMYQSSAPSVYQQPGSPQPIAGFPYRPDRDSQYHRPTSRPPPRVYQQDRY